MRITPSWVLVSLVCATAACGSSVDVEDGDGTSGTTSSGATAAVATSASSGAGPTTTVGSTTGSSSDGGASPSGSGGSTGEGGVSTGDGGAGVTVGQGGSNAGGAGPGSGGSSSTGTEPFLCGEVECAPDEECCGSQQGLSCIPAGDPCQGPTLTCQSAANCDDGQICCLVGDLQNAESLCADQCEPTQAGPLQLCESADECVEDVPCQEIFGGFKVCTEGFPGGP